MRLLFTIWFLYPVIVFSQVKVARVFSSNMVLQRDKPIPVWGKALPGTKIEVRLGNTTKFVVAAPDSAWLLYLPKQPASLKSQTLLVSDGETSVQYQNILVGDLWVCIGQSNMEWPMTKEMHWPEEKTKAGQPGIRLLNPAPAGRGVFGVPYTDSLITRLTTERFYAWESWQVCDSSSLKQMSAVAYYFAKKVNSETGVPIGIINLSIGGAPLETFISTDALAHSSEFAKKATGNWLLNEALPVWVRERGKQNVGSNPNIPGDEKGPFHAYKPGLAFEAGVKPLLPMPVQGIICYQGESNAQESERVYEYARLFKLLVTDYREKWEQPLLPFYFVQLSSIDTLKYKGHLWPEFRDEQRKLLQMIPHSGMAVCSDIGFKSDVHPTNKKDVGERLARWALYYTYKKKVIPSGPLPVNATFKNGKVLVTFKYIANGLQTSGGGALIGISTDGKKNTEAYLTDNKIVIPARFKPHYVYYGWKPYSDGNLINSEYLPASTFKIPVQ